MSSIYGLPVKAGRLRFRITIQEPVYTPDGVGGAVTTYSDVGTVWADYQSISPTASNDQQQFNQFGDRYTQYVVFTVRTYLTISNEYRISYDSRFFFIDSIVDYDNRKRMVQLYCREGS